MADKLAEVAQELALRAREAGEERLAALLASVAQEGLPLPLYTTRDLAHQLAKMAVESGDESLAVSRQALNTRASRGDFPPPVATWAAPGVRPSVEGGEKRPTRFWDAAGLAEAAERVAGKFETEAAVRAAERKYRDEGEASS